MTPNSDIYNHRYFKWHQNHTQYAIPTWQWFVKTFKPKSMVDFGCGIGLYLLAAYDLGIPVKGYDFAKTAKIFTHTRVQPFIEYRDCTKPINTKQKYDVVVSLETIEHIEPSSSPVFLDNLCNAGDFIVFSGAQPGQAGSGHINCQPRIHWVDQFRQRGYHYDLRTGFVAANWAKLGAPQYIIDNLAMFVRKG